MGMILTWHCECKTVRLVQFGRVRYKQLLLQRCANLISETEGGQHQKNVSPCIWFRFDFSWHVTTRVVLSNDEKNNINDRNGSYGTGKTKSFQVLAHSMEKNAKKLCRFTWPGHFQKINFLRVSSLLCRNEWKKLSASAYVNKLSQIGTFITLLFIFVELGMLSISNRN